MTHERTPVREPLDYRSAGVDLAAAAESKRRIRDLVESTRTALVHGTFGGFGGMLRLPGTLRQPVLVASADGVGTKLKVAIQTGRHDTIGHDLVNHCVNDVLAQGALPLFFLDYIAAGVLDPAVVEAVVAGVAAGCRENGCALLGGETAEMPGLYAPGDYDLAGFVVGAVAETGVLGPHRVEGGDVLVALASSGFHTNGYSLVRRVVAERLRLRETDPFPDAGETVADVLLRVHRSYLPVVGPIRERVHAVAHVTGGGLPGNLDRALPPSVDAVVDLSSWRVPPEFRVIAEAGGISGAEMFRTFNMGVGMVLVLPSADTDAVLAAARAAAVDAWVLGTTRHGSGRVHLQGAGAS